MLQARNERHRAGHVRWSDDREHDASAHSPDNDSFAGVFAAFARNAEIFGEGQPANRFYRVISGGVRILKFASDGRRQIIGFYLPGEMFGFEDSVHRFCAEAVSDTHILIRKRDPSFARSTDDPRLPQQFWVHAIMQLQRTQHHIVLLGRKNAQERLATFLLDMAERGTRDDDAIDLPMSRLDIADYLGLTIETVSRTLTQLARNRIIAIPASRRILMRNRPALEKMSDTLTRLSE